MKMNSVMIGFYAMWCIALVYIVLWVTTEVKLGRYKNFVNNHLNKGKEFSEWDYKRKEMNKIE
jgi:hypothetical protein